jgi:hypothetical protein
MSGKNSTQHISRALALGFALLIGGTLLAATPALADNKHNKWKHHDTHSHYKHQQEPYWYGAYHHDRGHNDWGPRVVYVEEPRYYVVPAPRYHPAPVIYQQPSINIILPLFD